MNRVMILVCVLLVSLIPGAASAQTLWYQYTISGADMMSFLTANGPDGSTAVDNGLYSGARLKRDGTNGSGPNAYRSYWASSNANFATWASTTTDRLASFNLWGYDGNGLKWGEYYKVQFWNEPTSTYPGWSSSPNWQGWIVDWPWGSPPANNNGRLLGWDSTDGYTSGLAFGASSYPTFTFRLGLDASDPFFPGGGWHNGVQGQLAFWFGGYMIDSGNNWTDLYEGNLVLQGTPSGPVPEPSTIMLLGFGLLGMALISRCRKAVSHR